MFSIFNASKLYYAHSQGPHMVKGILRGHLNRRHICCYVKPEKVWTVRCVLQDRWNSWAISLKPLISQGAESFFCRCSRCKTAKLNMSHVWKPVRYFLLFLIALSFPFQMLAAKHKHELLVDHPFSHIAGSCGTFPSFLLFFFFYHNSLLFLKHLKCREACLLFEHAKRYSP